MIILKLFLLKRRTTLSFNLTIMTHYNVNSYSKSKIKFHSHMKLLFYPLIIFAPKIIFFKVAKWTSIIVLIFMVVIFAQK